MRAMQFDEVEPGPLGPQRRIDECRDDLLDAGLVQSSRCRPTRREGDR